MMRGGPVPVSLRVVVPPVTFQHPRAFSNGIDQDDDSDANNTKGLPPTLNKGAMAAVAMGLFSLLLTIAVIPNSDQSFLTLL